MSTLEEFVRNMERAVQRREGVRKGCSWDMADMSMDIKTEPEIIIKFASYVKNYRKYVMSGNGWNKSCQGNRGIVGSGTYIEKPIY